MDATINVVAKRHYEEAVRQVIVYEREANDLRENVRRVDDELVAEQDRRRKAEVELNAARESSERHEKAAARYEAALARAVADVARFQTEIQELGKLVDDTRKTGRVAAILAGAAAVAATSVAAYLAAGAAKTKTRARTRKGRSKRSA